VATLASHVSHAPAQDGAVLLDIQHDRLLKLNAVAAEMWNLFRAGHAEEQIVSEIATNYGVDRQRVARDFTALLARIAELQVPVDSSVSVDGPQPATPPKHLPSYPWYGKAPDASQAKPKALTVFLALIGLMAFDLVLSCASIKALCSLVKKWPAKQGTQSDPDMTGRVCGAVDRACVWYPKKAMCLQRSAVTTCLLRSSGIPARMALGVRPMPFMAHAWVEVEGTAVNDLPGVKSFYSSLTSY